MNPVVWFEIYVSNMERATTFYETVLGYNLQEIEVPAEEQSDEMRMRMFPGEPEQGGASGALVQMEGYPVGSGGSIVYFGCEDCALEESKVVEAGGQVHQSKMAIGEFGFCTLAIDTEGNLFGLHSMK